jgi:formyltetrahydrofolate hydrolase
MVSFTSSTGTFWVEVTALDRQGLLRDLSELCARYELNISASTSSSYRQPDGSVQVVLRFAMDPKSWFDRDGFSSSLRAVSSVSSVLFR